MTIDLNCDMGELAEGSIEEALMPLITSANVACGGHAGDRGTMLRTVRLAARYGVAVGAHPGYPDPANFGRVEIPLAPEAIADTVYEQIMRLADMADVRHVKPHGALYNVAVKNETVARAIAAGVARWRRDTVLVGLAGSPMLENWRSQGFAVAAEAFADRRYEPDGTLRSRRYSDALITDPSEAASQALRFARAGTARTICIHGDTPGAAGIAAEVARVLREAGIAPAPLPRAT
jgi:UPF0271 protein